MGTLNSMGAAILGAGAMYFLDPDRGRRRRALVRDKAIRLTHQMQRGFEKAGRDLANRQKGIAAAASAYIRFRPEEPPDSVLEARVRSRLGRLCSHPHAIDVTARQGTVTLRGDVLAGEVEELVHGISEIPGVRKVENELTSHESAANIPSLQGVARKSPPRFELFQENWSPATRLLTGSAGMGLAIYGLVRGGFWGTVMGIAGAGMLTRSMTNMELKELVGVQQGHRIHIHKTLNIAAPVDKVYDFWCHYENFPRFMSHLKEVRETEPGRSHWIASGPGGISVEWDAEITEVKPKELLAWRSLPGSPVENRGCVRFEPNGDSGTRLTVQLSYQPPVGAAGHLLAKLFGADPKHAMDEDLVRLKSLLEVGKTRAHHEIITQGKLPLIPKALTPAVEARRAGTVH